MKTPEINQLYRDFAEHCKAERYDEARRTLEKIQLIKWGDDD